MRTVGHVIGQLTWGGAERQLYELATRTTPKGYRSIVFCLSDQTLPYGPLLEEKGVEVRALPRHGHFDWRRASNLRCLLEETRVDLVHSWLLNDNAYTGWALRGSSLPWIASVRSRPYDRDPLRKRIDRWALKRATRVLVNDRRVLDFINDFYGLQRTGIEVVPNGVDWSRLTPRRSREETREELETRPEVSVFLFAGRLERVKNLPVLLRAFEKLKATDESGWVLWIAGDGKERKSLEGLVQDLSLSEEVRFLGTRGDLGDLYAAADLFVLPSLSEGLPNVVLEAMGMGLPVLVSRGSGCGEMVKENDLGWIAPGEDSDSYLAILLESLKNSFRWKEMGDRSVETIKKRFGLEQMVCQVCSLYDSL